MELIPHDHPEAAEASTPWMDLCVWCRGAVPLRAADCVLSSSLVLRLPRAGTNPHIQPETHRPPLLTPVLPDKRSTGGIPRPRTPILCSPG